MPIITHIYAAEIEYGTRNHSAFIPDVAGCVATGKTEEEVMKRLQEAIIAHVELMFLSGDPLSVPTTPVGKHRVTVRIVLDDGQVRKRSRLRH